MRQRVSKLEQLMKFAEVASLRSHDSETQVGCVLVDSANYTPIAAACNGFISGALDDRLPTTRPEKYKYIVHSEMNMLANCAMNGRAIDGNFLVCTHSPCTNCMRILYQAGIRKVIVKEKYRDYEDLLKMKDLEIVESITPEGYFQLTYHIKCPKTIIATSNAEYFERLLGESGLYSEDIYFKDPSEIPLDGKGIDLVIAIGSHVKSKLNHYAGRLEYISDPQSIFNPNVKKKEFIDKISKMIESV